MSTVSPSSAARSSLEEMLDSLRRRDENERPKDLPPALPSRPTSRSRLPKRPLPKKFDVGDEFSTNKEEVQGIGGGDCGNFGRKRVKDGQSPYTSVSEERVLDQRLAGISASLASVPSPLLESEWDDSIGYFIKKKLKVWCHLRNGQWELGKVQSTVGDKASVMLLDENVVTVSTGDLLPANADILEGVDDLIRLAYLNEPAILHNLQYRYTDDIIYSKAGPVLVAINPFKDVQIYGNDFITAYKEKILENPHVYATTDTAYIEMMRGGLNQSLIISGESGAGKTETAKIAMQYLASLGGCSSEIESKIVQASCILEAFGNAKTSKNNNSSRFGKLFEVQFNAEGRICGAQIQTLLLEKSRVVQLARGERSYHVFYQVCAGAPSVLKDRLNLKMASEYKYLNQSGCLKINNFDDAQKFNDLMDALHTVQICNDDQEHIFEMIAAVLWLGNISFQEIDSENNVEVVVDEAARTAARLMGCSVEDLVGALSTCLLQHEQDDFPERSTLEQAIDTRDALAKFIYTSLFDWLVEEINKSLERGNQHTGRSINILDIYGFELFQKNSFEQFCINYANERLQQHFSRHLLKLEQEEYDLDGIHWNKVEFEDNQECLDLFEKKPNGLISLLDEESKFPKATDLTFANKLKQHLSANSCFQGERGAFIVRHYAGKVHYEANGFLEKNRDKLQSDIIKLLSSCGRQLPRLFASTVLNRFQSPSQLDSSDSHKESICMKFKAQLFKLLQQLENSRPHFILCIRPNGKQLPGVYEKDLVLEQLRRCGVMAIVQMSRLRYPTRLTHEEFASRFGCLLPTNIHCQEAQDPLSTSVAVLEQYGVLPELYQVGYTKMFLRVGQVDILENMRKEVLQGTFDVQKCFRGHRALRDFQELKNGVVTLQSLVRGETARSEYGVLINLSQRGRPLDEQLKAVVQLQCVIRGWLARRYLSHLRSWNISPLDNKHTRRKSCSRISESKDFPQEHAQILPTTVEELQRRVIKAEVNLGRKEQENAALQEQVQQFEMRWSEYEGKMKSVEEMWQKQIASLQMNLAAAKKSLGADNTDGPHGRSDGPQSPRYYDSEDTISGTHTHGGSTPSKLGNTIPGREANGVGHLVKEFEQQTQGFDNDAKAIVEVKPGQALSSNQVEEFRKLKLKFETWKKEYKVRLREAKAKLKVGNTEAERRARKWWGKISKRY